MIHTAQEKFIEVYGAKNAEQGTSVRPGVQRHRQEYLRQPGSKLATKLTFFVSLLQDILLARSSGGNVEGELDAFLREQSLHKYVAQDTRTSGRRSGAARLSILKTEDVANLSMTKYEAKRFQLCARELRDGAEAANRPSASARRQTQPPPRHRSHALDFSSLIRQKLEDDFAGSRQWVTDKFTAWLSDDSGSPCSG